MKMPSSLRWTAFPQMRGFLLHQEKKTQAAAFFFAVVLAAPTARTVAEVAAFTLASASSTACLVALAMLS